MKINANQNRVINMANPVGTESQAGKRKTINAAAFNFGGDISSRIEQRKNAAKNQAMKVINDAWDKDKQADENLAAKKALLEENKNKIYGLRDKIADVQKSHDDLAEAYGVAPDSQEQKDLELLEKYQTNKFGIFTGEFSDEEIARLKELENEELTDYQKAALSYNDTITDLKKQIEETEVKNIILNDDIYDAKMAELKNQNMLNANAAADEIMAASSKDIIGMIVQDAKENIDEKAEEEKEKAEKAAEEKEELQEKIDAAKEYRTEQEALVEEAREERKEQEEMLENALKSNELEADVKNAEVASGNVEMALRDIDKILKKNNLINEDIKGIEIDLDF